MVILETDQPVLMQQQYKVCKGGEYEDYQLVEVYMEWDETKFPIAAFYAKYIAEGHNPGDEIANNDNDRV